MNLAIKRPVKIQAPRNTVKPVHYVFEPKLWDWLMQRHFRKGVRSAAGNFKHWFDPQDVVKDRVVDRLLMEDIREALPENPAQSYHVEIDTEQMIGWSHIDDLDAYTDADYELVDLHKKCQIFRIRKDRTDLLAPPTTLVTITYELRELPKKIEAIILSMRPGEDIGPMRGCVSIKKNRVFFDWHHPGRIY